MLPSISASGGLVQDPEIHFTTGGKSVTSFSLACRSRKRGANGEWEDGDPTFIRCKVWGKPGEHLAESARKGDLVAVTGRLEQSDYEKDGVKRTAFEVVCETVAIDLQWTEAKTARARDEQPSPQGEGAWGGTQVSPAQSAEVPF